MKIIYITTFLIFNAFLINAQNVGINENGTSPDNNAMLDVQSSDKGILIPRLSIVQRNGIQNPTNGLMIYNTDCDVFEYWNGTKWVKFPESALIPTSANITASANPICDGNNLTLQGSAVNGNMWNWTGPNGFTSSLQNPILNSISPLEAGDYILTVGNTCSSEVSRDTLKIVVETIPSVPTATVQTNMGSTNFTANWNAIVNATEYYLDIAMDNSFSNIVSGYNNLNVGNVTSYNVTGLTCGNMYYYRVIAKNNCGNSSNYSNSIAVNLPCFLCGSVLTDTRDGETYATMQFGGQCWMAENLRYLPSVVGTNIGSNATPYYYVYGYNGTDVPTAKSQPNYSTLGVLYNWNAATGGANSTTNPSGVQGTCPNGWHIPSDAEWCQLENFIEPGIDANCNVSSAFRGSYAGKKLKDDVTWNGTNDYGFTVLKSGYYYWNGANGYFWNTNDNGQATGVARFWTTRNNGASSAYERVFFNEQDGIKRSNYYKEHGFSVRCVLD